MSTQAIEAIQARVAEIQERFAPQTASTSTEFGAALQNAYKDMALGANETPSTIEELMSQLSGSATTSGSDVVDAAKKYLGVPYVWGGEDASGMDCSGLVQTAYKQFGIEMPRVAADQARQGTAVSSLAEAKPGDLVAFGSPVDHIGIYVGDNKMIVAPRRGDVVKIQDVYQTPVAIRRIIPDTASVASNIPTISLTGLGGASGSTAVPSALSSRFDSLFTQAGTKYGISPKLLAAVAKQESGFNPNAVSGAGAQGLMQIMPGTAKGLGVNALDPAQAVDGAARMLSGLEKQFGSTELALAAYNAGPGAVQKYNGIPPYTETQNYVRNIMALVRSNS